MATEIRLPAEKKYDAEIQALIANNKGPRPPDWAMTPRAVEAYVMGSDKPVGKTAITRSTSAIARSFRSRSRRWLPIAR